MDRPFFPMLLRALGLLYRQGIRIVLVPGARQRIDEILTRYGVRWDTAEGVRVTTAEAIPFVKMAAFDASNRLMTQLAANDADGVIGNWVKARSLGVRKGVDYQHTGAVERIEVDIVRKVLAEGLVPILPNIGWNAAGLQIGAYEAALRYALGREQFGRPIAGFQLIQEKLTRMLGNATATLSFAVRLTDLKVRGELTETVAALAKTWAADRVRETVALGREIAGAEGIRVDNDLARYFTDAEAVYTYEGTHEMNSLIVGRAITGLSAFTR